MLETEPLGNNRTYTVDHRQIIRQWHGRVCELGLHRDIRFEGLGLDGLRLLITPAMPAVSEAFLGRVRAFVDRGGIWIAGPLTGTRTLEHTVPTDAGLGPLDALAGVETVFSFPVTGTGSEGEFGGHRAPLAGWCSAFRCKDSAARIVGRLDSPQAPGLGFIVERRRGKGAVVLLGAEPQGDAGEALLRALIDHYARQAGVTERYEVSPGTLVCPRVGAGGRRSWVVVNMDGKGGRLTIPSGARDARTGRGVAPGRAEIEPYGYRVYSL
jgi:beta-galactosidase